MNQSEATDADRAEALLQLPEFKSLIALQRMVSLSLTAMMLFCYFGFILLIAWRRDLLAQPIGEHLTLGLPLGVGLIVLSFVLTGIYVRWANQGYDRRVAALKAGF